MKTYIISRKEQIITLLLAGIIVTSFVSYIYLVNRTVLNVVAREEIEETLSNLHGDVSELEFSYITLKNSITMHYALEQGFQEVDEKENVFFASRDTSVGLSVRTQ
tara:strand:+ start:535 stop:852 length:318 start_codon:yes stop_codon:yes gene_type:complete